MEEKAKSKAFGLLFLAILIDLIGFGIIIPILPFLVRDIDPSREGLLLGWLLTSYSLSQFVFSAFWGRLSDRIGRRPVILLGLIGSSVSFALFAFVDTYNMYMLTRIIQGMFTAASLPTARAYIADITPHEERAKKFGLLGAAFGIGFTFGPAIGSLLSLKFFLISGLPKQATASLFAAFLALLNFALAFRNLPETLHEADRNVSERKSFAKNIAQSRQFFSFPGVTIILLMFGLVTMVFAGMETILAFFANKVDSRVTEDNIGYFFAAIGLIVAGAQSSLVGPAVERFGEEGTLKLGLLIQGLGYVLLAFSFNILTLALFIVPVGVGQALISPTVSSTISNRIPADEQGGGLGINSSVGSLGRVFGPLYGGFLFDSLGRGAPFYLGSVIIFGLLVLGVFLLKNDVNKNN